MDRTKAYLENGIFLLFCKQESEPVAAAKAISFAIKEALYDLIPRGKYESGLHRSRRDWYNAFYDVAIQELTQIKKGLNIKKQGRKK